MVTTKATVGFRPGGIIHLGYQLLKKIWEFTAATSPKEIPYLDVPLEVRING